MKILLHVCCGPCLIHPFEELSKEADADITAFFYNPNIHPYTEYKNRKETLEAYATRHNIPLVIYKYDMENFFKKTAVAIQDGPARRCPICWQMRLEEAAGYASENGYSAFTTTLLVSPYQDRDAIKRIGEGLSHKYNVDFLYKDFTPGFRQAQEAAKQEGLYRQKYCGCVFSEKERFDKKR